MTIQCKSKSSLMLSLINTVPLLLFINIIIYTSPRQFLIMGGMFFSLSFVQDNMERGNNYGK